MQIERNSPTIPFECCRIGHVDAGDTVRLDGWVEGKLDHFNGLEVLKQLRERLGLDQQSRIT
jgi:hypothetical protein